jgi:hypothetical protein
VNEYQARSRRLPAYRAIVAVDTVKLAGRNAHPGLSAAVPAVLEQTLQGAGLGEIWARRHFGQRAGGGYFFGTSPEYLPFLIDPLLDGLQLALEDRCSRRELRLRVSVHVGPIPAGAGPAGSGAPHQAGEPVRHAFRLLGSVPLRDALQQANPKITLTAAIVSQRVYDDVILTGYTGLHPGRLEPVTVSQPGQHVPDPAWLYVPIPSRREALSRLSEHRHAS